MNQAFIGIDVGTTRTKATLYNPSVGVLNTTSLPTPRSSTRTAGDLRDADSVVQTVLMCVDELIRTQSIDAFTQFCGIGVTSLSEEVVLVDFTGTSLGPMPTWYNLSFGSDSTTAEPVNYASYSLHKLRWAFDQIESGSSPYFPGVGPSDVIHATTLNSYIAGQLSEEATFTVDHSHASRTGFFDVQAAQWNDDAFAKTGWPASILPGLAPAGHVAGVLHPRLAARWNITPVPVVIAGHDHFCAAYGSGVCSGGSLYISAGTSEAHCLIVDSLPESPLPQTVGYGRYVDGSSYYLHRQLPSGHLYQQWRTLLGMDGWTQDREDAALMITPSVPQRPFFMPGFDTDFRSSVLDVSVGADRVDLLRGLLDGLACAAFHIDKELISLAQSSIMSVVANGVPCRGAYWQTVRSHLSVAPLSVSTTNEAPSLGAALLAQQSITGISPALPPQSAIEADPALRVTYQKLFERFETILEKLVA